MTTRIGIVGHQKREGADWLWVKQKLTKHLETQKKNVVGVSCLAKGADQIFAEAILEWGGELLFVQPIEDYESTFDPSSLERFRHLRRVSSIIEMPRTDCTERAYLEAGKTVVDISDYMIAVWDGFPAEGKGGTADIVRYALLNHKPIKVLDPIRKAAREL